MMRKNGKNPGPFFGPVLLTRSISVGMQGFVVIIIVIVRQFVLS